MKICGLLKTTLLDYPGHLACTIFTGGCNYRCPFCHNSELLDMNIESEYSKEEIFDFLDKRSRTLEGVAISGGEPTLQPDLKDFMRELKSRYGLKLKLDTNGCKPDIIRELIEAGLVDYIAMDIKAAPENYARVCGVKSVNMESIRETKDMLISGALPYEFRTTAVKGLHTEADFYGIAEFIKGCGNYYIQNFKDSGNILDKRQGFCEFSSAELLHFADLVRDSVGSVSVRGTDF